VEVAKIAVGLVRLDYSAEVVQHADLCPAASYWIGFTKFAHTSGDLRKQIGHSQARTGFRLNHLNVVMIDNSVRVDIVPKI